MDKNRIWLIGSVLLIAVTVVLGYMIGISPQLEEAARADEAKAGVEAQNALYEIELARLESQFANIGELQAELDDLRLEVPAEARFPDLIKQLEASASKHKVTMTVMSVSDPQLYVPIPVEAPAAPAEGENGADTEGASADTAAADAAVTPVAPTPLPAGVDSENFVAIPISMAVTGDYQGVLNFMESVQKGKRLFLVTTFSSAADTKAVADGGEGGDTMPAETDVPANPAEPSPPAGNVSSTITGYVYVLLDKTAGPETVTAG